MSLGQKRVAFNSIRDLTEIYLVCACVCVCTHVYEEGEIVWLWWSLEKKTEKNLWLHKQNENQLSNHIVFLRPKWQWEWISEMIRAILHEVIERRNFGNGS